MKDEKKNILVKTINTLKYYNDFTNIDLYRNDIPEADISGILASDKSNDFEKIINIVSDSDSKIIATVKDHSQKNIQLVHQKWMDCSTLQSFEKEISDCIKCSLLSKTRKQIVFGTGNPDAGVVVVGEAPGADEDMQGKPFVGRAGKLLTEILTAINFSRDEIYICNILKCRPPENRNPLPDEIINCEPYLFKQLELIKPRLILALGTFASQTLLKTKEPLGKLRGQFHLYNGIKMMATYHPAALLRNPNWKRPTWEDVKLFREEYDRISALIVKS